MLALNEFSLGEAAVGAGDYVFAAYQASEAQDAVRDQPRRSTNPEKPHPYKSNGGAPAGVE
jgi:hypothetical protein